MFADIITNKPCFDTAAFDEKSLDPLRDRIRKSTKFALTPEFAAAADELSIHFNGLARALEFVRLPDKIVWFEMAQSTRPTFLDGLEPADFQVRPARVGSLSIATRDDLSAWETNLFWSDGRGDGWTTSFIAIQFDMRGPWPIKSVLIDEHLSSDFWKKASAEAQSALIKVHKSTWARIKPSAKIAAMWQDDAMFEVCRMDWAGEISYLLSTLALLNAKNASATEYVDKADHNKKRIRRGEMPLSSHHVLRIHPRQMARIKASKAAAGHIEVREHFVRGHWKVRRTGIFFWHPFVRGTKSVGQVSKTYEVAL